MWAFFVPISAYYKGALKMFFVSERTLPFETLEQVLKVFPTWNLVIIDSQEVFFKIPAMQVHTTFALSKKKLYPFTK